MRRPLRAARSEARGHGHLERHNTRHGRPAPRPSSARPEARAALAARCGNLAPPLVPRPPCAAAAQSCRRRMPSNCRRQVVPTATSPACPWFAARRRRRMPRVTWRQLRRRLRRSHPFRLHCHRTGRKGLFLVACNFALYQLCSGPSRDGRADRYRAATRSSPGAERCYRMNTEPPRVSRCFVTGTI